MENRKIRDEREEKTIDDILESIKEDRRSEETIHLLLGEKLSKVTSDERETLSQKAADIVADFVGSWKFIIFLCIFLASWMIINVFAFKRNPFDAYPFILLNLILSCIAAVQSPLIMMSQNRKEEIDRYRSENDYKVNLKTEIIIEDIHYKLDKLIKNQENILKRIEKLENNRRSEK